ncbi:family 93 glycoside hydrolase [Truncatella angustata]|uniref:Family 93 glycoside hydrolase n=1 Tax=Truncatella angustata TaxID=152316 RepID=A0A9P8UQ57_9PEZI|nr:family 93 glycoside hydrolase [Truncatella angustata]KAH6656081.1 family 93 glycoside hydrolase [Truncatella angustata]
MKVSTWAAGLIGSLLSTIVCASPTPTIDNRAVTVVSNKVIFSPPSNAGWTDPRVLYARALPLSSGYLLSTWENYSPEPPLVYFPVYRSTDNGASWTQIGKVQDTVNGWGLRYQPSLYELPQAVGKFAKGTILAAGNSIPTDLSKTKIDVYASTDGGATWKFVSSVATGGEARPNNGLTPVWEPLLMVYNNQLVCYYSDQRDTAYGQKLVHQTTTDLVSWSATTDDVHDASNYAARPGMPAVAKLPGGSYIFAYEQCGTDGCRVHYRLAADPLAVLGAPSYTLKSTAGNYGTSSPSVVWSSVGGANGTIVLSVGSSGNVFTNRKLGDPSSWVEYATPQPGAYSRGLALQKSDDAGLILIGAGALPPSSTNQVSVSVVNLKTLLGV